ncbi:MAG: nitroreductase family protein [Halothiobacillus sp. 24-54-40]|jgi:nitroreductase|nr:nitroreductase family protein [Halothiobacillaceae bacterium]OYV47493.1 MAG: nitroreductase family protein [Halothiobacillus sp. 20-53-49]OYY33899.1 MAG: nitroreductase family protein [Halothiobacillus sp. 35-54-62]OYZ86022.1 MAG: nitroreductase family protein [Halothiobacillus sp. 24-54-40]OZA79662.1 MAG: nitroreductase family protein [Halothiobacillus sp. 39-53-45]HQS02767.1 nitroreductase family protein [Halothiobacillus sp.]
MHINEAIRSRRAVKYFDPAHTISAQDQAELIDLAMQSPTAFNLQHWRLVVVEDTAQRQAIRAVAWDQAQVTDASLLIILCADEHSWQKNAAQVWQNAPDAVREMMVPAIDAYYRDRPQVQRDEVMRSCGIVGQTLMLAARGMGLDSCPMDGFDFDAVANIINLPSDHVIAFMVAIGKKTQEVWPKPGQLSAAEVVIHNRFAS